MSKPTPIRKRPTATSGTSATPADPTTAAIPATRRSSAEIAAEYLLPENPSAAVPVSDSRSDDEDLDSGSVSLQETYAQLDKRRPRSAAAPASTARPAPAPGRRRSGRS